MLTGLTVNKQGWNQANNKRYNPKARQSKLENINLNRQILFNQNDRHWLWKSKGISSKNGNKKKEFSKYVETNYERSAIIEHWTDIWEWFLW